MTPAIPEKRDFSAPLPAPGSWVPALARMAPIFYENRPTLIE